MRKRWVYKITLLALLAGISFLSLNAINIARYSLLDETRQADCIIVAGAGIRGQLPSPVFQARLDHAIELYQRGYSSRLILTGGYSPDASVSDAAIAKRYVSERGVPSSAILIEGRSRITRENIQFAKALMVENHLSTALLVSDPLHMRRLMAIAEDSGISGIASPTPTTRFQSLQAKLKFLVSETLWYSGYLLMRLLPFQT